LTDKIKFVRAGQQLSAYNGHHSILSIGLSADQSDFTGRLQADKVARTAPLQAFETVL